MLVDSRASSPILWLGLIVSLALLVVGLLLWLEGDRRHALGAVPLILLLVGPLLHLAWQTRRGAPT